jgi:hypothetical protein
MVSGVSCSLPEVIKKPKYITVNFCNDTEKCKRLKHVAGNIRKSARIEYIFDNFVCFVGAIVGMYLPLMLS